MKLTKLHFFLLFYFILQNIVGFKKERSIEIYHIYNIILIYHSITISRVEINKNIKLNSAIKQFCSFLDSQSTIVIPDQKGVLFILSYQKIIFVLIHPNIIVLSSIEFIITLRTWNMVIVHNTENDFITFQTINILSTVTSTFLLIL